jgi:selenium metabolism protein YedF
MDHLDLKGKACPVPVIETKKFLESRTVREIEIIVDNLTARENVCRFLGSKGYSTSVIEERGIYRIEGCRDDGPVAAAPSELRSLVYIDGEFMGRGSEELGKILMRSFLNTVKDLEMRPWRMVFINAGVKLVASDSEYVNILKDIEGLGVEIIACGTCLDYFHLKDKIGVGRISNMFEIMTSFNEATNVIRP